MTFARPSHRSSSLFALALTAATGCQIDMKLGELDDPSSSSDGTGSATSTTEDPGHSGVNEDTSAGSATSMGPLTSGDTETTAAPDETTDTAAEACLPLPESLFISVEIDVEVPFEVSELSLDADCTVVSVTDDDDARLYGIECDEEGNAPVPHLLEVERSPGPIELPLAVGAAIHVQVEKCYPIDHGCYDYIVVRDMAGELVLGRYDGYPVNPAVEVDVDAWFAPLEYGLAFGDCEPVPYVDMGGSFIVDPCPAAETRLAVDFQLGDESIHLLAGTSGQLGALSFYVTGARHLDPVEGEEWCGQPVDTFSFVTYREE